MQINANDILGKPTADNLDPSYECFLTPLPNTPTKGLQATLKAFKTNRNDAYTAFMPKIYCGTDKFFDWRTPRMVSMLAHSATQQDVKFVEGYQAYVNLISFSLLWAEYKTPTFFIEPNLLEAVQNSGLPRDFDFTGLQLPFPALTFLFPKKSPPFEYQGHPVQYIGIARINGSVNTKLGEVYAKNHNVNKIIVTTGFYPSTFVAAGFAFDHLNEIVTMDIDTLAQTSLVNKNDAALTHKLLTLALSCVLGMEARPELVERERKLSVIRSHNSTKSLWTPNIVGRSYVIRGSGESTGTHSSPRTHWRRGHFRRQGIGQRSTDCQCDHPQTAHDAYCQLPECVCENYQPKGFQEYKTVWIEPCLVNAPTINLNTPA